MLIGKKCKDANENIYTIVSHPISGEYGVFVVVELDGRLTRLGLDAVHLYNPATADAEPRACPECGSSEKCKPGDVKHYAYCMTGGTVP